MEIALTEQVKLITTADDNRAFSALTEMFSAACTDVSEKVFSEDPCMSAFDIQSKYYKYMRETYGLKSQMAISASKMICARYKAIDTQMKKLTYTVVDESEGEKKTRSFQKDVNWLWKPVVFSRPQADLVRGRDWSWKDGMKQLSINTLEGRHVVSFACRKDSRLFLPGWKHGTAKLIWHNSNRHWYLHISVTGSIPEVSTWEIQNVEGHDRGIVNLVTTRTEDGRTNYKSGSEPYALRNKYDRVRASLQSKGTKGAKRVLKLISGRETRMMSDVDHTTSKTLVHNAGAYTLHVMEDLTGISFDEDNLANRNANGRHDLRNWTFYSLEEKTSYKAAMMRSMLIKVDPAYTSQRCPKCGNISKEARNHEKHEYKCPKCHGVWNDDEVGAMNIRSLGIRYLAGEAEPSIKKRTSTKPKTAPQKEKENPQAEKAGSQTEKQ